MDLFCFAPPPSVFYAHHLQIICCYKECYYVKNSMRAQGWKRYKPTKLWGGGDRIYPKKSPARKQIFVQAPVSLIYA